jgi:hypothetical protein
MEQFVVEYRFKNGVTERFLCEEGDLDRLQFAWMFSAYSAVEIEQVLIRRAAEHQYPALDTPALATTIRAA